MFSFISCYGVSRIIVYVEILRSFVSTISLTWVALPAVFSPQIKLLCSLDMTPSLAASSDVRVPYVSTSSYSPMPATGKSLLRVKKMIEVVKKPEPLAVSNILSERLGVYPPPARLVPIGLTYEESHIIQLIQPFWSIRLARSCKHQAPDRGNPTTRPCHNRPPVDPMPEPVR